MSQEIIDYVTGHAGFGPITAPIIPPADEFEDRTGHIVVKARETLEQRLLRLCTEIHADNVKAGWWSDLKTGESILETRNRPEIMMLIVSELSEASEGWHDSLQDDKLPHLPMFNVELADTAIRLFDAIGAEIALGTVTGIAVNYNLVSSESSNWNRSDTVAGSLMHIVNYISAGMEHFRKGRRNRFAVEMMKALYATFYLADFRGVDLFYVIEQKRAVNRTREDHKVENRRKEGGKAF